MSALRYTVYRGKVKQKAAESKYLLGKGFLMLDMATTANCFFQDHLSNY